MRASDCAALAAKAAGNHRRFECFAWFARPPDSDQWTIVYTHNRDSDVLEQSNAAAIAKRMAPYVRRGVGDRAGPHPLGRRVGRRVRDPRLPTGREGD